MFSEKCQVLNKKIEVLRKLDANGEIFSNQESLTNTTSLIELNKFEKKYHISLPESYKLFLNKIGGGRFDVLPLKEKPHPEGYIINNFECLEIPFPHLEKYERAELDKFIEKYRNSDKFVREIIDLDAFKKKYKSRDDFKESDQLKIFDYDGFYESDKFIEAVEYEYFYSDNHLNGTIYLNYDEGQFPTILIVSGKHKGSIWEDWRGDGDVIFPTGQTFYRWFDNWLTRMIKSKSEQPN